MHYSNIILHEMGDDVKQNKKVTKRCLDAKILSKLKISRLIEHLLYFEGDFLYK